MLVGIARDPSDAETLAAGEALARALGGAVTVLHVDPDVDGATHADRGLRSACAELAPEVLVIGTRYHARGRTQPGTTTRGLLAAPPCPLWVHRGAWTPPDRVVAAIDEPERDAPVLARAFELAVRFQASLVALHCQEAGRPTAAPRDRDWFQAWVQGALDAGRAARREACAAGTCCGRHDDGERDGEVDIQVVHLCGPPVRALMGHVERADVAVFGRGERPGLGRVLHEATQARRGPLLVVPGATVGSAQTRA